jgi:hypothetical protein
VTFSGVGVSDFGDWLRAGGVVGTLALLVKFYLENRKLRLQEKHDDRDGYGVLIQTLQADVTNVREQLRGVHRQLVMNSSNQAISLGQPSADVAAAAERAKNIVRDNEP